MREKACTQRERTHRGAEGRHNCPCIRGARIKTGGEEIAAADSNNQVDAATFAVALTNSTQYDAGLLSPIYLFPFASLQERGLCCLLPATGRLEARSASLSMYTPRIRMLCPTLPPCSPLLCYTVHCAVQPALQTRLVWWCVFPFFGWGILVWGGCVCLV